MNLTVQVHWNKHWHDAGTVRFQMPGEGLRGAPSFSYSAEYALAALEQGGDFETQNLIDKTAVSVNLPCHFGGDYHKGEITPVLRDIIPQGAGRRHWVKILGYDRDPAHTIDTQLLKQGCIAPIGNLRIKEAAEAFQERVSHSDKVLFSREDVCARADNLIEYAQNLRVAIGGATGAGGDAPKLLLLETHDGHFALEGTISETEVCNHWLVKFPRGRKTQDDIAVLQGEAAIYKTLEACGVNSISGARIDENKGQLALWLPRFDRAVKAGDVVRHGVESVYSMMGKSGDGSALNHVDVVNKLKTFITEPKDKDALLAEYLVRDILNTATGNRDNHGRNTSIIKRGADIELAPTYDVAPMVLDSEAIARTTRWPLQFLNRTRDTNYTAILEALAVDAGYAARLVMTQLEQLRNMKNALKNHGAPAAMLNHAAIRFREAELVLDQLDDLL
ncbi:type II toxin-antitoxin system HipA family toxin [Marinobacter gelidimuriae]|uniref:type II toxin-antitoxin system HipA family toxin n=1 Tax=Marinobacter gelidimuriae TaxID=2739064 RepID=UPI00035F42A9|nr:HipA domain-containing protein [Marinobacter gelidimuriae]